MKKTAKTGKMVKSRMVFKFRKAASGAQFDMPTDPTTDLTTLTTSSRF